MSFQYVPGILRTPRIPVFEPPEGIWRGRDADEGLFAFEGFGTFGNYVMVDSANFVPHLKVDGADIRPVIADVNGYIYWSGGGYVYYTQTWGWVICDRFPGYEPIEWEEVDPETRETTYRGDAFYVFSFPYGSGEVNAQPRGQARGREPRKVSISWRRWVCQTEFGVYEGKDGASGTKVLGVPQFSGGGETFVRSATKEDGWYYTYGRIHRSNGKWVIGEIGSSAGWHEGSEPQAGGGSTTFAFCRPEGSDVTGQNIVVSFDRYVLGESTTTAYLGEAAVWR